MLQPEAIAASWTDHEHPFILAEARRLRQQMHGKRLQRVTACFKMAEVMEDRLDCRLESLHKHFGPYPLFRPGRDANTPLHQKLYAIHQEQKDLYRDLCHTVIHEFIQEDCYVQSIPTYRVGLPGNRWVGSFHRDSDFGHSAFELNVICAFTRAHQTAALHVETEPGNHLYTPLTLEKGEIISFDHIERLHGCRLNREGYSTVSIDFRFVPKRFAQAAFHDAKQSINTGSLFAPGDYFTLEPLKAS